MYYYPQYTDQSGKSETDYFKSLYSEKLDNTKAPPPRLRYAILAQPRTGSELVSAHLRRQGIGIPLEYFHRSSILILGTRWSCLDPDGKVNFGRYCRELERRRTTPSAAFGLKVTMPQISWLTGNNMDAAAGILESYDKILVMRRRDTLRQALSLMRALYTGQWHIIAGDEQKPVLTADVKLTFDRVTYCWARVLSQERDMARVEAALTPGKLRTVWYEDLLDPRTMPAITEWLCAGSGVRPQPAPDHALPMKGDSREADAILKAYMDYIGVDPL